jgi:hypothetical protein
MILMELNVRSRHTWTVICFVMNMAGSLVARFQMVVC